MSMRPSHVPVGASILEVLSGIVTKEDAWTFGKRITCTHKVFYGSDGFKSDYQSHRIEYIILAIEGEKTRAFRYSGKNLPFASKVKEDLRPHLRADERATEDTRGNCGECLMAHVDVVPLNLDGTCSCCATGHKLAEVRK